MRIWLAALAGGLSAGLTTILWMFFGKHVPPTFVPAAAAAASGLLVLNAVKKKARSENVPSVGR